MKKKNNFLNIVRGFTSACTLLLFEVIMIICIVSTWYLPFVNTSVIVTILMLVIGTFPMLMQTVAYKCNSKDYHWTPIAFIILIVLNILLTAFFIGMELMPFIILTGSLIPMSMILLVFSAVCVSLVDKGYETVYKKTSMQIFALWAVLWVFVAIMGL
ncbi:MAG: hypothetical protein RR922_06840 [Clostridia bacterium]